MPFTWAARSISAALLPVRSADRSSPSQAKKKTPDPFSSPGATVMSQDLPIFCHLTTGGPETNLQLYSLYRAWTDWQKFKENSPDSPGKVRERCAFIVNTLALSLAQLLGQNVPTKGERVDGPQDLLRRFLEDPALDKAAVERISRGADELWPLYNAIHHFGKTPNSTKYEKVSTLDAPKTEALVKLAIEVWDLVIQRARRQGADLDEFESIVEILDDYGLFEGYQDYDAR